MYEIEPSDNVHQYWLEKWRHLYKFANISQEQSSFLRNFAKSISSRSKIIVQKCAKRIGHQENCEMGVDLQELASIFPKTSLPKSLKD